MADSAAFSGSIPANYDRFLGPVLFEPFARDLAGRLPAGRDLRVLEAACGTGIVSRRLRAALSSGSSLTATDLNEPMLEHARARVGQPGIVWQQADAERLPFPAAAFDVYVCQFGLMFLPDKVQGLREARRVLAPGGRLLATVWRPIAENLHMTAIQTVLDRRFPEAPLSFFDVPHGYGDVEQLRRDGEAAGWPRLEIEVVRLRSETPSARDFALGIATGSPLAHELSERGADLGGLVEEFTDELVSVCGDRPFVTELVALVVSATVD